MADVQDACSEDSRSSARRAKAVARLEAVHQRAGRRDRRENGAIKTRQYAADAMRQTGRSVLAMLALLRSARPLMPKQAVRCLARRPVKKRPTISMALCAAASQASNVGFTSQVATPSTRESAAL